MTEAAKYINKMTDDQIKEILSTKGLFKMIALNPVYLSDKFMTSIYIRDGLLHFDFPGNFLINISIDEFKSIIREKKINCILE